MFLLTPFTLVSVTFIWFQSHTVMSRQKCRKGDSHERETWHCPPPPTPNPPSATLFCLSHTHSARTHAYTYTHTSKEHTHTWHTSSSCCCPGSGLRDGEERGLRGVRGGSAGQNGREGHLQLQAEGHQRHVRSSGSGQHSPAHDTARARAHTHTHTHTYTT